MSITIIKADPGNFVAQYIEANEDGAHRFNMLPVIAWEIEEIPYRGASFRHHGREVKSYESHGTLYRRYDITPIMLEGCSPYSSPEYFWLIAYPSGRYGIPNNGLYWGQFANEAEALDWCQEAAKNSFNG